MKHCEKHKDQEYVTQCNCDDEFFDHCPVCQHPLGEFEQEFLSEMLKCSETKNSTRF